MKIIIKLLVFLLLFSSSLYCQHEADNWYFGYHVAINFSSGEPIVLEDSEMNSIEGCASISNQDGELLFYTNGENIWNREHNIMPNGDALMGHESSTQSTIIVKQPQTNFIYYIFTTDEQNHSNGFRYSVVDMNLDSNRGDVNETKNIPLLDLTDEKITVIRSSNQNALWILTFLASEHTFYAYYFDENGIDTIPVISVFDSFQSFFTYGGYLKASHDGSKIVACTIGNSILYEFDNVSGELSNPITLYNTSGYGAEFSPNNQVLYISDYNEGPSEDGCNIIQLDLSEYSEDSINNSFFYINGYGNSYALQIGPDEKIYCGTSVGSLNRINNPNILGDECNYEKSAVTFEVGSASIGLPNFFSGFKNPPIYIESKISMPNIFTPNNDGLNDRFIPIATNDVYNPILSVYDRWGVEVFSGDLHQGWDGYQSNDGVYFWIIKYKDQNGINKNINGPVTLAR